MNTKTNKHHIQQGDVLLRRINTLPEGCVQRKGRTLAYGEHTGHHHTFNEGVAIMDGPDNRVFVHNFTDHPVEIQHQEHGPVTIEPGFYEFGTVVEKDWFSEMVRPVID